MRVLSEAMRSGDPQCPVGLGSPLHSAPLLPLEQESAGDMGGVAAVGSTCVPTPVCSLLSSPLSMDARRRCCRRCRRPEKKFRQLERPTMRARGRRRRRAAPRGVAGSVGTTAAGGGGKQGGEMRELLSGTCVFLSRKGLVG